MVFILKNISYRPFESPGKQANYESPEAKAFEKFFDLGGPAWSYALARSGTNQNTLINPTGPPGYCLNLYMSLVFDLPKDGWAVKKIKETLDVTPMHHQYYELTHGRKETLEAKIREGLVKISQSIADLELVKHDLIKYEDFEEQLESAEIKIDEKAKPEEKKKLEGKKKKAELALKTTFMEEVDYHAGGSAQGGPGRLSMAFLRNHNIMPTVVDDFFRMNKKEDLEKDKMLKDLPTVEKRMLEVKWDAYQDWLGFFKSNVTRRMDALRNLEKSREKSLDEYREWLKPTIARHKLIVDSLDDPDNRKGVFANRVRLNAIAISMHYVKLWFWKSFVPPDPHRVPGEEITKAGVMAFGNWERDNLYLNATHGLITDYPWITEKWIFTNSGIEHWGGSCKKSVCDVSEGDWYYSFQELTMNRTNFKTSATGSEGEDTDFEFVNYMMSKNVVAAKSMELKAMQEEQEIYISEMLGLPHKLDGKPIIIYQKGKKGGYEIDTNHINKLTPFHFIVDDKTTVTSKDFSKESAFKNWKDLVTAFPSKKFLHVERKKENETISDIKKILGLNNIRFFLGRGPYEQNWSERIKKYYLKPNSARFEYVRNFLISRMGVDY